MMLHVILNMKGYVACVNEFTGNIINTETTENGDNSDEKGGKSDEKSEIDGDLEASDSKSYSTIDIADRCNC